MVDRIVIRAYNDVSASDVAELRRHVEAFLLDDDKTPVSLRRVWRSITQEADS